MIVRNKETGELFITHDTHACAKDEKMEEIFAGLRNGKYEVIAIQSTIEQAAVTKTKTAIEWSTIMQFAPAQERIKEHEYSGTKKHPVSGRKR